jgi:cytochrome c peroxidase
MRKIGILSFSAAAITIALLSAFLEKPASLACSRPVPALYVRPFPALHARPDPGQPLRTRADRGPATPYPLIYPAYFGNRINTREDNPLTMEGVALGRRLFYEKRLSVNNTISCGTCHQQQHAFTDGRPFSLGFDGTPTKRNSMSLANLLWVRHFFWDGRAASLEAQAMIPLTDPHEMGQPMDSSIHKLEETGSYGPLFAAAFGTDSITHDHILMALTQFERTLISANAPYDKYIRGEYQFDPSEKRGLDLFFGNTQVAMGDRSTGILPRSAGCGNCHGGPKTFNETYHNNGLDRSFKDSGREEVTGMSYDRGRFRVVTLRNIALTAPYMHDGRFATLQEVIDHYSDHVAPSETLSATLKDTANMPTRLRLTLQEKSDLLAFLHTLTDTAFINDPRFSDPFVSTSIKDKLLRHR